MTLFFGQFTSELSTKIDEMQTPLVHTLLSEYPSIFQKNNYHVTQNNPNI